MIVFTAVCAFALLSGASNFLEIVYPNELFPTEVRATAVGTSALRPAGSVRRWPFT